MYNRDGCDMGLLLGKEMHCKCLRHRCWRVLLVLGLCLGGLLLLKKKYLLPSVHIATRDDATRNLTGDKIRYLIFQCVVGGLMCGGWADRQEGLVSAFLLANLTQRRFGLRMNTPCNLSLFYVPASYDWVVPDSHIRGLSSRTVFAIDKAQFCGQISSMDFNAKYPEDVVFIQTNRDFFHHLSVDNPNYRDVLPWWARQPRPEFFRHVWTTLMKPSPALEAHLQAFLGSVGFGNPKHQRRPLVGAHVRIGKSSHFADNDLKGIYGDRLSHIDVLWDFLQPYKDNGSHIFVATDNLTVRNASRARFGPGTHHDIQVTPRHVDRQRNSPDICQAFEGALLDQLILSRCDVLVVSPWSGFSSRAAMLRGSNSSLYTLELENVSPVDLYQLCIPFC